MDCIDRQAVIDLADEIIKRDESGNNDVVKAMKAWKVCLKIFPSVEPEIIRCKDCKQFRRWIDTDTCFCDITEAEVSDNDFCSKAEKEV